jgi:hypothetical protein
MGPEVELFLQALQKTPEERELTMPLMMPKEAFQDLFKAQNEDTIPPHHPVCTALYGKL